MIVIIVCCTPMVLKIVAYLRHASPPHPHPIQPLKRLATIVLPLAGQRMMPLGIRYGSCHHCTGLCGSRDAVRCRIMVASHFNGWSSVGSFFLHPVGVRHFAPATCRVPTARIPPAQRIPFQPLKRLATIVLPLPGHRDAHMLVRFLVPANELAGYHCLAPTGAAGCAHARAFFGSSR